MASRRKPTHLTRPLAAIDVGTNAVRLVIARAGPDGAFETLHQDRDPVRPGEGVFATGALTPEVADRLLSTLRRYAALCRRFDADVRAVATSALREARNGHEIVARVRDEAGVELEIISGQEEARLICLGVLHGAAPDERSMLVDIGGGSTELAWAVGETPRHLCSANIGAVRLTEIFEASGKVGSRKLELLRRFVDEALRETIDKAPLPTRTVLGSSGTIGAVVAFAAGTGRSRASVDEIGKAVERLASMTVQQKRRAFDARRAQIVVAGAVVLERVMKHLRLTSITAVAQGLRDGVLIDLLRRRQHAPTDPSLPAAALALGHRFGFDAPHSQQVRRLALTLFDELAVVHGLPEEARPLLETAALLHDIGHAVSPQRHHKHTEYLLRHADLPGVTEHERHLVALIARFHRRSPPERSHSSLAGLSTSEFRLVRRSSTLLRVADGLDRSHQQPVKGLRVALKPTTVALELQAQAPVDLELWDAERETELFRRVFDRRLVFSVKQVQPRRTR